MKYSGEITNYFFVSLRKNDTFTHISDTLLQKESALIRNMYVLLISKCTDANVKVYLLCCSIENHKSPVYVVNWHFS